MTKQKILDALEGFQHLSDQNRRRFLGTFEKKMLYRTTKTENPETTPQMVRKVLDNYAAGILVLFPAPNLFLWKSKVLSVLGISF